MCNTTRADVTRTLAPTAEECHTYPEELVAHYDAVLTDRRLNWTSHYHLRRLLGSGGQGKVYLTEHLGADGFTLPIALKIFSPERFADASAYEIAMERMAHVAAHVAQIQHDNLLDVQNFLDRSRIRMMVMEWIDGYDLGYLLDPAVLGRVEMDVSGKRWEYINNVIATAGATQTRLKAGVAMAIVRDGLAALAALHREGIVHGDIKPSNIMLKRTGLAKIVDIGSAFEVDDPPVHRTCTPSYAAPEVLEGQPSSPKSDLASMGYVLIELLSGQSPFEGASTYKSLLEAKRALPHRLHELLPAELTCNDLLMSFCRGMIAPDPNRRFPSAEHADLQKGGAAAFQRQLVKGDLSSEYNNELRKWLEEIRGAERKYRKGLQDDE